MKRPLLSGDEWIGFQLKEGPCSAGCEYCYERPAALNLLNQAVKQGKIKSTNNSMNNFELALFISKNKEKLSFEFNLKEIEKYFELFNEIGLNKTFLVGSEPTEHSNFNQILDCAENNSINLLVYTSGRNLDKLFHPAVKFIVLHLSFIPSENYMQKINSLLEKGKEIHFRVNFSTPKMKEKKLVFSFFDGVKPEFRPDTILKYSFTTRVLGQQNLSHFTPVLMKKTVPKIISFVNQFKKKFPNVKMYSERPLFPCVFPGNLWEKYKMLGGFTSRCEMEFVVYPDSGLNLCPPARNLLKSEKIKTPKQLSEKIFELKRDFQEIIKQPSFIECEDCIHRTNLSCQGGCGGYKQKAKQV